MASFSTGQKVTFSAQPGTIISIEAGKRGLTLATIRLNCGRVIKTDTRLLEDSATAIDCGRNPGQPKHGN